MRYADIVKSIQGHNHLVDIVEKHLRGYDYILKYVEYDNNNHHGEIDLLAIKDNFINIYEIKTHYCRKNFHKAIHQLHNAKEYVQNIFNPDKINLIYISEKNVRRIYEN